MRPRGVNQIIQMELAFKSIPMYIASYSAIEAEFLGAALLAGAAACLAERVAEWHDHLIIPSDTVFSCVQPYADDADSDMEPPETATNFLLLVRLALFDEAVNGYDGSVCH